MAFQDLPIKRKVMAVIMLTSITVLLLTAAAFMAYDLITFQTTMKRNLNTLALVTADYSTAALAFQNEKNAYETLYALHADAHIVAAALYDEGNNIYARYPTKAPVSSFPAIPGKTGPPRLENGFLVVFKDVVEKGSPLGTLYLKFDRSAVYERLRLYGAIALMVLVGSVLVALALSNALQQRISQPILALADTARVIS